MKEHLLTLFLAVTTVTTMLAFNWTRTEAILVFNPEEILFEHHTVQGKIMITTNPYEELTLSFLNHTFNGFILVDSAYATDTTLTNTAFLSLPATENIPFTIYAITSANPELHQIIVTESGLPIAHGMRQKKTTCPDTHVFLVTSSDLIGKDALILGLDQAGAILVEIEMSAQ